MGRIYHILSSVLGICLSARGNPIIYIPRCACRVKVTVRYIRCDLRLYSLVWSCEWHLHSSIVKFRKKVAVRVNHQHADVWRSEGPLARIEVL